ncbi:MAG TPA: hypothetical protein VLI06_19825 [Solimonas sp.]|nr:hypothetical protein [Solimonas sp.]
MDTFETIVAMATVLSLLVPLVLEFADVRNDQRRASQPPVRSVAAARVMQLPQQKQTQQPEPLRKAA